MTEQDGKRRDAAVVVHEGIEERALFLRFIERIADYDERRRQFFRWSGFRPTSPCGPLHRRKSAELQQAFSARRRRPRPFRPRSAAPPPTIRLHDDRPALHRPCEFNGPRTDKLSPLWLSTCIFAG